MQTKLYNVTEAIIYLFVQTVGDSSSCRFIDDTKDIQSRNCPCIFGGLALRVIKVGRHSHYSIGDSLQEGDGGKFQQLMRHWIQNIKYPF